MRVMTELEVEAQWRRPSGHLDRKVCWLVALGCVLTLAVAAMGPRWFWSSYGDYRVHVNRFWIENGLVLLTGAVLVVGLALRGTSAALRLALALPLAHVAAIVTAWAGWNALSPRLGDAHDAGPIVAAMPMGATTLGAIAVCLVAGRLASRRRDWVHGTTVFALGWLLAVGLWLPLAANWYCRELGWMTFEELGALHPFRIAAFVLVPPAAAALAYTLVLMRAPALTRKLHGALSMALPVVLIAALVSRAQPPEVALTMYGNFVHVLLALTIAVIAMFAVLALGLLARARRARSLLAAPRRGTVICDGTAIALELTSWLRGPRYVTQPFTIATPREELVVPAGIEILAPLPDVTTQLEVGELLDLVRQGDPVVVGGFVDADASHPFRGALAALPGDRGVVVAHADRTTFGDRDLALVLWRPCVAYLVIVVTIALPGLIAALAV